MQRKSVALEVKQLIAYHNVNIPDEWLLKTAGELIELKGYSKITYQDKDKVTIEVKWYETTYDKSFMLEIKQPNYTLVFKEDATTETNYMTPQDVWKLEVVTQNMQQMETSEGWQIAVDYQIIMNDELLGDYQFRLHYAEQIGNI